MAAVCTGSGRQALSRRGFIDLLFPQFTLAHVIAQPTKPLLHTPASVPGSHQQTHASLLPAVVPRCLSLCRQLVLEWKAQNCCSNPLFVLLCVLLRWTEYFIVSQSGRRSATHIDRKPCKEFIPRYVGPLQPLGSCAGHTARHQCSTFLLYATW